MKKQALLCLLRKLAILTLAFNVLIAVIPFQIMADDIGTTPIEIAVPHGVTAVSADEAIIVMWEKVDGAVSYKVYYGSEDGKGSNLLETDDNSLTIDGLVNGKTYMVQVLSVSENNESELSNKVSATPEAPNPPSVPTIDQAVAGDSSIAVTWQLLTDSSVAGYFVSYKEEGHPDFTEVDAGMTNSFIIDNLVNDVTYQVAVTSYDDSKEPVRSDYSEILNVTPVAGAASLVGLRAMEQGRTVEATEARVNVLSTKAGDGKVKLTWQPFEAGITYDVRCATENAGVETGSIYMTPTGATSYIVPGLSNGTTYEFSVEKTGDTSTRSLMSASTKATPQALSIAITTPAVTPYTLTEDVLTVSGTSSGSTDIKVYVNGDGYPVQAGSIQPDGTWTRTISGLTNGTTYDMWAVIDNSVDTPLESTHKVVIVDRSLPILNITSPVFDSENKLYTSQTQVTISGDCNTSDLKVNGSPITVTSGQFSFSPMLTLNSDNTYTFTAKSESNGKEVSKAVIVVQDQTAPAAISGLSAVVGNGKIDLSWSAYTAPSDIKGYNIYYGTSSDTPTKANTGGPVTAKSFSVTSLTNGTAYYFAVTAVDKTGNESAKSTTPFVRTPSADVSTSAPTNLSVTSMDGKLKLTWTASSGAGGYYIYYGTSSGSYGSPIDTKALVTSWEITGLTNGTTYYVRISAYDASESKRESEKTSEQTGKPLASSSLLGLTISVDKATANLGDALTYSIEFKNLSAAKVNGVEVKGILPSNLSYITNSATDSPSVQNDSKTLVWSIGDMDSGATKTVSFKGTINSGSTGTILTKAELKSSQTGDIIKTATVSTTMGLVSLANTTDASGNIIGAQSESTTGTDPNTVNTTALPESLPYTGMELRWYFVMLLGLMAIGGYLLASASRRKRETMLSPVNIKKRYLWTSRK